VYSKAKKLGVFLEHFFLKNEGWGIYKAFFSEQKSKFPLKFFFFSKKVKIVRVLFLFSSFLSFNLIRFSGYI